MPASCSSSTMYAIVAPLTMFAGAATHSSTEGEAQMVTPMFLSRRAQPATQHCRSGSSSLNPAEDEVVCSLRTCGLHTLSIRIGPRHRLGWVDRCPSPIAPFRVGSS